MPFRPAGLRPFQLAVFLWSVGGAVFILLDAIRRLFPMFVGALGHEMHAVHWLFLVVWVAFMAFVEGYKGFHQRFSPRLAVRADWLARHPRPWLVALAPLFVMGMVHANRRRLVSSWLLFVGIVALALTIRQLPQPWRGIVDAGVVLGLTLGTASTVWFAIRTLAGRPPAIRADLPTRS